MSNGIMVARSDDDGEQERRDVTGQFAQELRRQGRTAEALSVQFNDIALRALMLTTNLVKVITDAPIGDEAKILLGQISLAATQQVQSMTGELKSLHQEQKALLNRYPTR